MAVNKVVDRLGNILIDLSTDTIDENKVLEGETFHGPDGEIHTGKLKGPPVDGLDLSKYNFIDYDGSLMYTFTDEEIDAMEELPTGPDHTDENLTFQEWNWSLEGLKSWNRSRPDRPIVGANLITTDGKSYLYLDTPFSGAQLSFQKSGTINSVDWGDGTIDTNTNHTYANPGAYTIIIDITEGSQCYWYFGSSSVSTKTNRQFIRKIKLGKMSYIPGFSFSSCSALTTVNIPSNISSIGNNAFEYCYSLKSVIIPNSITSLSPSTFYYSYGFKTLAMPANLKTFGNQLINNCHNIENVVIPDSVTSIDSYAFGGCSGLRSIFIPDSVTSVGSNVFASCFNLENIKFPDGVTKIGAYAFSNCSRLTSVVIGDGVTSIGNNAFERCHCLRELIIPDSVTSIGSNAFSNMYRLTLDLSKQTKVISLSSSLGFGNSHLEILVPSSLLDSYKSAAYWSNYANYMVGV